MLDNDAPTKSNRNIALIGFSGTGKSSVAKNVSASLGWKAADTDQEIVTLSGESIPHIFNQKGERAFRQLESEVLKNSCGKQNMVISTGGGAILDPDNAKILTETCFIIYLQAKPETIYNRLKDSSAGSSPEVRPLLNVENPLQKIKELKNYREPYYSSIADWTIHTDELSIDEVAQEVIRAWERLNKDERKIEIEEGAQFSCLVKTQSRNYAVLMGWGLLDKLGKNVRRLALTDRVAIISDENVFSIYGNKVNRVWLTWCKFKSTITKFTFLH